jgi:hypothetical protein
MPKATDDHTTSPEPADDRGRMDAQQPETADAVSEWPLGDIEVELIDLRGAAGLLEHMSASSLRVEHEELVALSRQISAIHGRLVALWRQAFEAQKSRTEGPRSRAGRGKGA